MNEMCQSCKERVDGHYCHKMGVQTNSEDVIILSCDEFKPIEEPPYLKKEIITTVYSYNPNYGDNRICECGHTYIRHFDSYENMEPCGCKYCGCYTFKEKIMETPLNEV